MTNQRGMIDNADHGKFCGCHKCNKCISWSAIFVGAFVGLGISFLLNLFSIAIGLVAYKNSQDGAAVFAIGGYLGLVIGAIVAYFFAGWTAGHLGFPHCAKDRGMFYGFTTWVVSGIMAMLLAGYMGHYASYRTSLLTDPNASYVTMTTDNPNASGTTTITDNSNTANNGTQTTVSNNKVATAMMTAAFATFFLFLISALSSMLGAHCAYRCRFERENHI